MVKYTARQWVTLALISLGNIGDAMTVSILAPFFPSEAEAKGVSPTIYGFIFGAHMLTMFFVSPICGKYINKFGLKTMFISGLYVCGLSCIAFAFLTYINHTILFICVSFLLKILSAIGNASCTCASFSLIPIEFPESVTEVFGLVATTWGLGAIIGPMIGGVLYEVGGFLLPFLVNGSFVVLVGVCSTIIFPKQKEDNSETENKESLSIFSLFKVPETCTYLAPLFAGAFSVGFLQTSLEVHLRQFNLSPVEIGAMFMIEGISYSTTSPLWGLLSKKLLPPISAIQLCAFLMFTSFLLIGPAPFLPISSSVLLVGCGVGLFGVGFGGAFVVGFDAVLQGAFLSGFPNNMATNGIVSGIFTSAFSLGCFIGPSLGGYLLDYVGFRWGSLVPLILNLIAVNTAWIYMCFHNKDKAYIVNT